MPVMSSVLEVVVPTLKVVPVSVKAPDELTAETPVVLVCALMAVARLSNLRAVMAMSVTDVVAEVLVAVTEVPDDQSAVVKPAVKLPV